MTELYDGNTLEHWYEELTPHREWNKRHLYALYALMGTPSSLLDVGCGLGDAVWVSRRLQIDAYGIDQLIDEEGFNKDWFFAHDLRTPFSLGAQSHEKNETPSVVDMVLCWEVAEHIPEEYLDIFCSTIANHVAKNNMGGTLVFTSAHPGQSGTNHVSAKPSEFWKDRFYERGLNYQEDLTRHLALLWTNINSPLWWLASNVMVFRR